MTRRRGSVLFALFASIVVALVGFRVLNSPMRTLEETAVLRVFGVLRSRTTVVGDHNFQKKCIARIRALQSAGTTILFVSHAAGAVEELCGRAIWIHEGLVAADGNPKEVLPQYLHLAG